MKLIADFSANVVRDLKLGEGTHLVVQLPAESLRIFAESHQGMV